MQKNESSVGLPPKYEAECTEIDHLCSLVQECSGLSDKHIQTRKIIVTATLASHVREKRCDEISDSNAIILISGGFAAEPSKSYHGIFIFKETGGKK